MDRATVINRLRAHEAELKALGLARLSLFGSVARNEQRAGSDIDLSGTLDRIRARTMFDYAVINNRLSELLGRPVDLVSEPARRPIIQQGIDRDRVHVF